MGADLVGKVEAGIPEDDPRNPAVIADNVGDNVGDCAGMAADLFETYAVTIIATMLLGALLLHRRPPRRGHYPLVIGGGLHHCLDRRLLLRQGARRRQDHDRALQGPRRSPACSRAIAFCFVTRWMMGGIARQSAEDARAVRRGGRRPGSDRCSSVITEYYTGDGIRAGAARRAGIDPGHATNIIAGLGVSMKSTAWPVIAVCVAIWPRTGSPASMASPSPRLSMLSMAGIIVALDAYGPITDNAGGIAEMADLPSRPRVTDPLDAVGNTTKAVTKGYAIGRPASRRWCSSPTTPTRWSPPASRQLRPVQPHGDHRPVHRRPDSVPVQRHGDGGGGPRCRRGRHRGAPSVQGNPGHHGRHGQAGVRRGGRHAHRGRDQGNDRSVAAAGAGAVSSA